MTRRGAAASAAHRGRAARAVARHDALARSAAAHPTASGAAVCSANRFAQAASSGVHSGEPAPSKACTSTTCRALVSSIDHRVGVGTSRFGELEPDVTRRADDQDIQSNSSAIAVASPPPMHSAATPFFLPRLLQRTEQRDDDARARGADRVAERAGAAVHVDDLVRQPELRHRRHRDRGEGLVDLPQVDGLGRPSRPSSAPSRSRPPARCVNHSGACACTAWRDDARDRLGAAACAASRLAHQHQRRGAVGDARRRWRR